jgi:acetoin utilization deacetylase AcuC-like enzyme
MLVVASNDHRSHDPVRELVMGREVDVYEKPARAEEVASALREARHEFRDPTDHGPAALEAVHDAAYLEYLRQAWPAWRANGWTHPVVPDTVAFPRMLAGDVRPPASIRGQTGYYTFDTATPLVEGTHRAAVSAANCALTAADLLLAEAPVAFALCRPPGHHAGRDFAGGYCFLNNAALAVTALRADGGSVAVLDLDFHHGNGTQQIFWDDPEVLTLSIHGDPNRQYPYFTGHPEERGGPGAPGANLNLPLPEGIDGDTYLEAVEAAIARVAEFDPTRLVVPFGADTFEGDPLGDFVVRTQDYGVIGYTVGSLALPTVITMEGGYAVEALGANVAGFLDGLERGLRAARA